MPYDADAMRAKLKKQLGGRAPDPNEFRVPKVTNPSDLFKYRFYILPPISKGDKVVGGTANQDMDLFYLSDGAHWVNNKPHPCPRVISNDQEECPMCKAGFELLAEVKAGPNNSEENRKAVTNQWLPQTNRIVNIYFPAVKSNSEELRGRVMWFKANKTLFDMWKEAMMRDDPGPDEDDPQAFGMFFDEQNAFLFNLVVNKDGVYNGYKQSRFITKDNQGQLACGPIAVKADGSPDKKAIQAILDMRHDLYSKIEEPNQEQMRKLAIQLGGLAEGDEGFDQDETSTGSRVSRTVPDTDKDEPKPRRPARQAAQVVAEADEDLEIPPHESLAHESPLDDEEDEPAPAPTQTVPKANGTVAAKPKRSVPVAAAKAEDDEDAPEQNDAVKLMLGQLSGDDD